ncbi:hypothetical protein ACP70R_035242 [Stipagrostis hirtigluma subsp. patula]
MDTGQVELVRGHKGLRGVVLYELLYGRTETFHCVLTAPPEMPGEPTPLDDLIARLHEKDPARRLDAHRVKRHAFFRGVDWDHVLDVARPPFIPIPAAPRAVARTSSETARSRRRGGAGEVGSACGVAGGAAATITGRSDWRSACGEEEDGVGRKKIG